MRNRKSQSCVCKFETMEPRLCFSESMSGATMLTLSPGDAVVAGNLNNINKDDFFTIHLAKASTVHLKLTGLSADATLELIADNNHNDRFDSGETVVRSNSLGTKDESIERLLNPGTYFLRVSQSDYNVNTKYFLHASTVAFTTPDQKDTVGDDIKHAKTVV